jgi:beta-lactamase regulating signal transducer with metallopeptidase domain
MTWLVTTGLTNALVASLMAFAALAAGRLLRRPALARLLWVLVLCKLLTPTLVRVPLGEWFHAPRWLAEAPVVAGDGRLEFASTIHTTHTTEPTKGSSEPPSELNGEINDRPRRTDHPSQGSTTSSKAAAIAALRSRGDGARNAHWTWTFPLALALRWVATVWIAGSLLTAGWLVRRYARFQTYLKLAGRGDQRLHNEVSLLAHKAGMSTAPRVVVVDNVVSPLLWGIGRHARLVFPTALAGRLDSGARQALLLHELAHHARGDWRIRLLELAVQVVYWWHPLVGWARREIEAAEEECCDAWVLAHMSGTRRTYAEALLTAIDFLCEPTLPTALPPAACGLGDVPLLRSRLSQIMCGQVAVHPSRATLALVLGAAMVVLPLGPSLVNASSRGTSPPPAPPRISEIRPKPQRAQKEDAATVVSPAERLVQTAQAMSTQEADSLELPVLPRMPAAHYATAISPNGRYKLEARVNRKTTLIHDGTGYRLDLSAHKIACTSYSPDSRLFATGHDDSVVRIWYSDTGVLSQSLRGSEGAITSVAFAPDGRHVAAGTSNGDVHVWDLSRADEVARLRRQPSGVSCVRWSQHGDRLAVALGSWSENDAASLVIWSPEERAIPVEPFLLDGPAGAIQWLADDTALVVAAWNGRAQVWNLATREPVDELQLAKEAVSAAGWSADCPLISNWNANQLVMRSE